MIWEAWGGVSYKKLRPSAKMKGFSLSKTIDLIYSCTTKCTASTISVQDQHQAKQVNNKPTTRFRKQFYHTTCTTGSQCTTSL